MGKMYTDVKTWQPQVGCRFDCIYCKPSFRRMVHRVWACQGKKCTGCRDFSPHEHAERLRSFPSRQHGLIWPCAHGDISFGRPTFIRQVIDEANRHQDRTFYWQSKNPQCFEQYLSDFSTPNSILLTTLETNRDDGYYQVSKAPLPSERFQAFRDLKWDRKILTIEPIMDFDEDVFYSWIVEVDPEAVWIGYNSHPTIRLPEPSLKKTRGFISLLRKNKIQVRKKFLREKVD